MNLIFISKIKKARRSRDEPSSIYSDNIRL
jgi:hypothetical protein